MNSALQCLGNLDVLRAYFLREVFKTEINLENVMGSKGEVVTRFAELLNQLWNKQKSQSFSPYRLKNAIGKANSMFKGDAQHDSQEFLNWMLDQLHEDLNRVKVKKYVEMPELEADDATVAKTYWDLHLQRN